MPPEKLYTSKTQCCEGGSPQPLAEFRPVVSEQEETLTKHTSCGFAGYFRFQVGEDLGVSAASRVIVVETAPHHVGRISHLSQRIT